MKWYLLFPLNCKKWYLLFFLNKMIIISLIDTIIISGLAESEFLISKDPAFGTYTAFAETTVSRRNTEELYSDFTSSS